MKKFFAFQLLVLTLVLLNIQASKIEQKKISSDNVRENITKEKKNSILNKKSTRVPANSSVTISKETSSTYAVISKKLRSLKECYHKQDCKFSKKDPRSYDLAITMAIKQELTDLYEAIEENAITTDQVSQIARDYITSSSGHVKEACIKLFSTQPPVIENLNSLLEHALFFHSDRLVNHTMMEIRRYMDIVDRHEILSHLKKAISRSNPAVRENILKHIAPFIAQDNIEEFKEILKTLPKYSLSYKYLKSAIDKKSYQ